ncbi:MAG: IS630 transposase-related protein [Cyanobacteria bacterium P01_D01_bin.115]
MAYSLDLRQRVIERVRQGHSVEETAALFQVSPATIYRWRQRPSLERTVVSQRRRKLDPEALRQHVRDYPEARLKDRAKEFGVHPSAIGFALKRHRITVKKNSFATGNVTIGNDKSF